MRGFHGGIGPRAVVAIGVGPVSKGVRYSVQGAIFPGLVSMFAKVSP